MGGQGCLLVPNSDTASISENIKLLSFKFSNLFTNNDHYKITNSIYVSLSSFFFTCRGSQLHFPFTLCGQLFLPFWQLPTDFETPLLHLLSPSFFPHPLPV